jgi:hypothetical protein
MHSLTRVMELGKERPIFVIEEYGAGTKPIPPSPFPGSEGGEEPDSGMGSAKSASPFHYPVTLNSCPGFENGIRVLVPWN